VVSFNLGHPVVLFQQTESTPLIMYWLL